MMLHGLEFSSVVTEDGTVEYTGLTWTKNADGTYAVAYRNGDSRTYTVSQDGTTLTTDDGRMKTKCSPSMIQVAAVIGPWYNKEMMKIISLNADGTGILKGKDVTAVFTWKADGTGKYIFTVTDGKDVTNASLKGKEIVVTFDNIHNALIDSEGNTFVRPAETVKDLIQVH
ncbi:MAG TPA: hypothetical protein O0X50_03745 [Methanocorpusculum sp.]|nr:hypothetical protein [Methanocorpusculum sp.]